MKVMSLIAGVLFLSGVLLAASTPSAIAEDNMVRAMVGIQVEESNKATPILAKARDRFKAGDKIRIYVTPEEDSYVYVVYSDQKSVALLNKDISRKVEKDFTLVLPDAKQFYPLDGSSDQVSITIISSPTQLTDIVTLLASQEASPSKWTPIEGALIEKSKIDLSGRAEKPFAIGGNVRESAERPKNHLPTERLKMDDPFFKKLQIFSGKSLVVRRYEFTVKK